MTFLLTGASGFVGGHVAQELIAAGHTVRAVVRSPDRAAALRDLGIALHQGDVASKETMRAPMTGVDGVFHIAGWYKIGIRAVEEATATNIDGTRNVLELMQELGVPKGVYTSTLAVNSDTGGRIVDETYRFSGRHVSLYDRTKAEAHRIADSFIACGLPLVIVQPGAVYGPGDTSGLRTLLIQYLQRRLPLIPRKTAFAWAHVDDIARGHLLAMKRGQLGQNYFLAGPVHTVEEALDLAEQITGIPVPRLRVGPAVIRAVAAAASVVETLVPFPPAYSSEGLRVVAGLTYVGSHDKAERELGWHPRSLREGLTETLRHEMTRLGMSPRF